MNEISNFVESLPDGWTIYLWLVVAAFILIGAGFMLRWAAKNNQFDEDIKYVLFDSDDKEKMEPEEFEKYKNVMEEQTKEREEFMKRKEDSKKASSK